MGLPKNKSARVCSPENALQPALEVIAAGGTVACPTETYYGLCAAYDNALALERLFNLKGREKGKPFPLISGSIEALAVLELETDPVSFDLMKRFWPGPLTLILKTGRKLPDHVAKNGRLAIRVPGPSFALELAKASQKILTATSANPSGLPPADDAAQVLAYFGNKLDLIVDGGRTAGKLPSTIVEVRGGKPVVLREGAISAKNLVSSL